MSIRAVLPCESSIRDRVPARAVTPRRPGLRHASSFSLPRVVRTPTSVVRPPSNVLPPRQALRPPSN
eukprot:1692899-Pyramimonas_sp.AAC.1